MRRFFALAPLVSLIIGVSACYPPIPSPHNMILASIKRAGFRNAARAGRWFDGHLNRAFALLITGISRL